MATIQIRDISDSDIEKLKEATGESTGSKAMLKAAQLLPGHQKKIADLERKLQFLESKHSDIMAFVSDYTRALSNLTNFANGS